MFKSIKYRYFINKMDLRVIIIIAIIAWFVFANGTEGFGTVYWQNNIKPTFEIDPEYYNINDSQYNYYDKLTVGDPHSPAIGCSNVTTHDLIKWLHDRNPHVLYQYVYLNDPSIDINNPTHAPRVLRMLLRNASHLNPIREVLNKCYPLKIKI